MKSTLHKDSTLTPLQAKPKNGASVVPPASGLTFIDNASVQRKENKTGMPDQLKSGVESLSGIDMSDVKVHYNSSQPAQLNAHAYAQGNQIHIAPGQDKHLPHEAWHVVQQKQGRVNATKQLKGKVNINDDVGLEKEADVMGAKAIQLQAKTNFEDFKTNVKTDNTTVQREPWDVAKNANETALAGVLNAPAVPGTHPTQIGPNMVVGPGGPGALAPHTALGERHFDQRMLNLIQTVFNGLPSSHIKGNSSLARVVLRESGGPAGAGMASFYSPGNQSLNLVVPGDVSSWIYMQVEKWPFGDSVTTLLSEIQHLSEQWGEYQGNNISAIDFLKETISAPYRFLTHNVTTTGSSLDKVKTSLSTEGFLQWIIRHETGHSVDDAIGWYANQHYRNPATGGWRMFIGAGQEAAMVNEILNTTGLTGMMGNLNAAYAAQPLNAGAGYNSMLNAVNTRRVQELNPTYRNAALTTFEGTNPGGRRLVDYAENVIRTGLGRPWENGSAVDVGGRAYQRDTQHDDWESYIYAKYALRNSNYQFQNPGEWFAESYQAFFKGQPATWGQKLNDPVARAWFNANLVPVALGGGGALINALGNLTPIGGVAAPIVAPGAGTAAIPTTIQKFASLASHIAVTTVKIPFDLAMGAASVPVQIAKKVPPVNWALKWLGF